MKMVSSKKYNGVYHTVLGDGDVTYYIYYRDEKGRQRKDKVGRRSEGMTEDECNRIRLNTIASVKNGEPSTYTPLQKKNGVATLNDLADFYFENQSTANSKIGRVVMNYVLGLASVKKMSIGSVAKSWITSVKN